MRTLACVVVLLSAPVSLFLLAMGARAVYDAWGMVAFLLACGGSVIACLSIAFLFDTRQPPPPRP